jgi:hypothetical protein
MGLQEDVGKLRKAFLEALNKGLLETNKELYEATLIQIMNEAERNRQTCANQAESLRKQAAIYDGQAQGFSSVSSIVFAVMNGFITVAERQKREEDERAQEEAERAKEEAETPESESSPEKAEADQPKKTKKAK